jgi:hypothetical protein
VLLDSEVIDYQQVDKKMPTKISRVMLSVYFTYFDQREIDNLLAPFYTMNRIELITPLSIGRSDSYEEYSLD